MLHGYIIRGTTPTHEFGIPYNSNIIRDIRVTYGQNNKALFTKYIHDCKIENNKISVSLIQEETFLFTPNKNVTVEIRVLTMDGDVVRSEEPIVLKVIDSMSDEVLE